MKGLRWYVQFKITLQQNFQVGVYIYIKDLDLDYIKVDFAYREGVYFYE